MPIQHCDSIPSGFALLLRQKQFSEKEIIFFGNNNLDPSIYRMGHSDFIVSKSLKRDKVSHSVIFCFQDIAKRFFYTILQTFIEWFGLSLQGT